jgi:hypothetical protein
MGPWQAFNTFVDDVFAFAIAMPISHRIACLRDDVVFVVFLYQVRPFTLALNAESQSLC